MGWSKKKVEAIANKIDRKPAQDWTAGDRIGKISLPVLRDLRMRALGGEMNVDRYIEVVELLEDVLEIARDEESDSMVVAEELGDFVRKIIAARDKADEEKGDAEREHEKAIETLKEEHAIEVKEHEDRTRDIAEACDELRRRAELAEHNLAESVRNGHGLDQEAADRIRRVESERNALLAAAKEAIPEGEHPADPSIVHDWAWQLKVLGEDRRAVYKQKAEAEHALANERTATKLLEDALERQRKLTPMKKRGKAS